MRLSRRLIPWTALVLVCVTPPAGAQAQGPGEGRPTVISLPDDLDAVLRGYEDAWSRRDAEALAELFTEDGFVLRPGNPPAQGRAAILEAYRTSGGPLALWAYGYAVEGSVGYIVGAFAERPGQPPAGKFMLALRRSDEGVWLIAADMDNGDSR